MEERLLPPEAHALAAQIEDGLARWNARNDAYNPMTEIEGARIVQLCGDLIVVIGTLRDRVDHEVREYQNRRGIID